MVLLWAWLARRSRWMTVVLAAVPALIVVEIAIPDERLRLLAIGVVTAAAFATTVYLTLTLPGTGGTESRMARDASALSFVALGVSATLLLRWIPLAGVEWKKEWIVLAGGAPMAGWTKERTALSPALACLHRLAST